MFLSVQSLWVSSVCSGHLQPSSGIHKAAVKVSTGLPPPRGLGWGTIHSQGPSDWKNSSPGDYRTQGPDFLLTVGWWLLRGYFASLHYQGLRRDCLAHLRNLLPAVERTFLCHVFPLETSYSPSHAQGEEAPQDRVMSLSHCHSLFCVALIKYLVLSNIQKKKPKGFRG